MAVLLHSLAKGSPFFPGQPFAAVGVPPIMPAPGPDSLEFHLAVLAGVALLVGHDHPGYLERVPDSLPSVTGGPFQVIPPPAGDIPS